MNKQDFLNAVRLGVARFRVDKLVVNTDTEPLNGNGVIEVTSGKFRVQLNLTGEGGGCRLELPRGIKVKRQFWLIQGIIEDEIGFSLRTLPSNFSQHFAVGLPERLTMEFSANCIELSPTGIDCVANLQSVEIKPQVTAEAAANEEEPPQDAKAAFHAVLPNFKLIEKNGGTETKRKNVFLGESRQSSLDTFRGEVGAWVYGLVERDGDLHVHLCSKFGNQSLGEAQDWFP